MKKFFCQICLILLCAAVIRAQNDVSIFIIDSYITPETPHKFVLSFFATEEVSAELVLNDKYTFTVSEEYKEDHKIEVDLTGLRFDTTSVEYYIRGSNKEGIDYKSEMFSVKLPSQNLPVGERNSSLLSVCCLGGVIFGLPSPTLALMEDHNNIALSKEIPVLSFYTGGYNYPAGYVSLEYTHIFEAERNNYLRFGYKHLILLESIEYISGGITGFTDFNGFNGAAPELSIGLFKLYNVFTLYTRYRFNFQPSHSERNFHEISVGLYSNFFSINL